LARKGRVLFVIPVVILLIGSSLSISVLTESRSESTISYTDSAIQSDLEGIRVALFESYQTVDRRVSESRGALFNMLTWMNATVEIIDTTDILYGALWAFELLVIPEGLGPSIEYCLGAEAEEKIREWIALGGSYIGVRGSSTIAVTDGYFEGSWEEFDLGLINGTSVGMPELGHTLITPVNLIRNPAGPTFTDIPDTINVLFRTARYFVAHEGQEMIALANYTFNNQPAMVAARYGDGNVFISSPHFEYEENSDRDGTEYMDSHDDPDSEWPFMLIVAQWLIGESPNVCNTTTWSIPVSSTSTATTSSTTEPSPPQNDLDLPIELLVGGSISVVALLVIVLFLKKRP
jgi:glutamine amidotransferase-like uncharacterized protein